MSEREAAPEPRPEFRIEVQWPGGRNVLLNVVIEPALTSLGVDRGRSLGEAADAVATRHDFDRDVLRDDPPFIDALRRWTVSAKEGEVVQAQCVAPRLPDLLLRLKVTPPIPATVPFELPTEDETS